MTQNLLIGFDGSYVRRDRLAAYSGPPGQHLAGLQAGKLLQRLSSEVIFPPHCLWAYIKKEKGNTAQSCWPWPE